MDWLIKFFARIVHWLHDYLLWLPLHICKLILQGIFAFMAWLPVPQFMTDAVGWVASIPPSVAYFLSSCHIGTGMTYILTAYILRFVLRRIPFIG